MLPDNINFVSTRFRNRYYSETIASIIPACFAATTIAFYFYRKFKHL